MIVKCTWKTRIVIGEPEVCRDYFVVRGPNDENRISALMFHEVNNLDLDRYQCITEELI